MQLSKAILLFNGAWGTEMKHFFTAFQSLLLSCLFSQVAIADNGILKDGAELRVGGVGVLVCATSNSFSYHAQVLNNNTTGKRLLCKRSCKLRFSNGLSYVASCTAVVLQKSSNPVNNVVCVLPSNSLDMKIIGVNNEGATSCSEV